MFGKAMVIAVALGGSLILPMRLSAQSGAPLAGSAGGLRSERRRQCAQAASAATTRFEPDRTG